MPAQTATLEHRLLPVPHLTVDVHYGRFFDAGIMGFRARLKRDMPHFNFEQLMMANDRWIITSRNAGEVTGVAVFSGARAHPVMDFYYAVDLASTRLLMAAINAWRRK